MQVRGSFGERRKSEDMKATSHLSSGSSGSSRPLFSVIIPTYNYAHYLPRSLDSVAAQGEDDCELIVVDDGSQDDPASVLARWTERVKKPATCLSQPNRGLAAARNRGIDYSAGEWLLFLDADDALLPDALDRFRLLMSRRELLDFIYGGRTLVSADGKVKDYPARPHLPSNEQNFSRYIRDGFIDICAGSVIIHRHVFERIRFQERAHVWEDVIFHAQLFALFSGASIRDPVITIHRHADSLSHHPDLESIADSVQWLFDPSILPQGFLRYRDLYACRTRIALFHAYYNRGELNRAISTFRELRVICPSSLLNWRTVRRYVTALIRMRRGGRKS